MIALERINNAWTEKKDSFGYAAIADIRENLGETQAEIENSLMKYSEIGCVKLCRGEWSLASDHEKSGGIEYEGGTPFIQVKMTI